MRISVNLERMAANFKNRQGQITLVALLLGVLGLTIGLSVVSRSLNDLKQASYVDFGTRALAAAESGAEYGLGQVAQNSQFNNCATDWTNHQANQLYPNPSGGTPVLNFSSTLGIQEVDYMVCRDLGVYSFSKGLIGQDDVYQVVLNPNPSSPTNGVSIYWTNAPGVEVAVLYQPTASSYSVKRFVYGPSAWQGNATNFAAAALNISPGSSSSCVFPATFSGTGVTINGLPSPISLNAGGGTNATLIRIKPIGGSAYVGICPNPNSVTNLVPGQFTTVIGRAITNNNTTRVISVQRDLNGYLPSIFDNVIFSGGSLTK